MTERGFGQFLCVGLILLLETSCVHASELTDAVVKVFVAANEVDHYRPWQSKGIRSGAGSGAVIEGGRILTNAHVVADHTFIQVKKDSDSKKYTARVEAIGHDCDLALLKVDDPHFLDGVAPFSFGGLPHLRDKVTVLGYPQGGGKISITEGVVSRLEVTSYTESNRQLLTVQIDAAINPGNSGGPVVHNGELAGIAMQVLQSGQSIGYMIPVPVIRHFLDDLKDGQYDSFPLLGIEFANTENPGLREYYKAQDQKGGVVITEVLPFSPADGSLRKGDILFEIDGVLIGEDGTFKFRGNERLSMSHLITQKQTDDDIQMKIIRGGKIKNVKLQLTPFVPLVPPPRYFKQQPPYFIFGGLVFTVLSSDLIQSWGNHWWEKAPLNFNIYFIGPERLNANKLKEVVVLLNVLPDDINAGYHDLNNDVIQEVDGQEFKSFQEFVLLLEEVKDRAAYTIFETRNHVQVILSNKDIDRITKAILERNNIPRQFSEDVAGWFTDGAPQL